MSFTRLLAAGRSIMGMKEAPSPYRMTQDHLLPKFNEGAAAAFTTPLPSSEAQASAGADPGSGSELKDAGVQRPETRRPLPAASRSASQLPTPGGFWAKLKGRWAQRRAPVEVARPSHPAAVQGELSLDSIKVVRNDLRDSDAAETPRRRGRWRDLDGSGPGMVWNRLSARLLRQAVQDFNVVQRQRGKLLSHSSHVGGGARRT